MNQTANQRPGRSIDPAAVFLLVVLCASWGLQQVTIKVANTGISPIWQAGIRSIGATVLLWIWMQVKGIAWRDKDGTLWWGIAAGILFAFEFLLMFWGLEFTNASRGVIFVYTSPFVVAIGAQLFLPAERMRPVQVAGLVCAFAGIVVAFNESLGLPSRRMLIGDAMMLVAAISWGATTVMIKASPLRKIAASKTLLYQLAVSALLLPLGSLVMNEPGVTNLTPLVLICLLYQTLWVAATTYLVWFWLIKRYSASRMSSFTFLTPLFGVLAGGLLLDEPLTAALLIALILVGTGIYLVNRPA